MYTKKAIEEILKNVSKRSISPSAAFQRLRHLSYESLSFAQLDHHRPLRKNLPEVVYAPGKTLPQLEKITDALIRKGHPLLITRLPEEKFRKLKKRLPKLSYSKIGQIAYLASSRRFNVIARHRKPSLRGHGVPEAISKHGIVPQGLSRAMELKSIKGIASTSFVSLSRNDEQGTVAIVTAGTSDIPVAEEARITLETIGRKVNTFYDLGIAGLHRLLDHLKEIEKSDVIICIAGMEGALPSVLAGLVSKPVIAVPTSIGYGSSFKGITPLLTMLNSCAQGVAVVNIDSGFNAACFAHLILP